MTLDQLIDSAAERLRVDAADLEAIASTVGTPVSEVMDTFARRVAERYLRGDYSYTHADAAMNGLFSIMSGLTSRFELTELGWLVYDAFDQGEFTRPDGELQGEPLTRALLARIPELSAAK